MKQKNSQANAWEGICSLILNDSIKFLGLLLVGCPLIILQDFLGLL